MQELNVGHSSGVLGSSNLSSNHSPEHLEVGFELSFCPTVQGGRTQRLWKIQASRFAAAVVVQGLPDARQRSAPCDSAARC